MEGEGGGGSRQFCLPSRGSPDSFCKEEPEWCAESLDLLGKKGQGPRGQVLAVMGERKRGEGGCQGKVRIGRKRRRSARRRDDGKCILLESTEGQEEERVISYSSPTLSPRLLAVLPWRFVGRICTERDKGESEGEAYFYDCAYD